jgi:LCP family protein required for cell wall assembly
MTDQKPDIASRPVDRKHPGRIQIVWWVLGLVLAIALFLLVRGFVTCYSLTSLPGIPPASCSGPQTSVVINPQGTPVTVTAAAPTVAAPQAVLPSPWDGASRVNILIMGLDYRDVTDAANFANQGPARSDTMWLLTIDPITMTAGGVSIPRDLWVDIPGGFGYAKINTAYLEGELYKLPGGGPAEAMKTVSEFIGVPIQYYAVIQFSTFINAIDRLGGVEVCLPAAIDVGRYDQNGIDHLPAGCQTLNGIDTLGLVRNRYTANGDVDRSNRQKLVLQALLDKIKSPKNWATLVAQAPGLYQDLSKGLYTNLNLTDAIRLAALAREIPADKIDMKVIDYTMMTDTVAPDGTDILRPFTDKIEVLRDEIFGGGELGPAATGDETSLLKAENARVVVINGTGTAGLAAQTKDYLTSQGLNVIAAANTTDYPDRYIAPFPNRTILILHSGAPYAERYLINLMKFSSEGQVIVDFNPGAPEDILVGLGYDWAASNPLPK